MKKIIFFCIAALLCFTRSYGQNHDRNAADMGMITLAAYVPQQIENMPEPARLMLANKLTQIITEGGMAGSTIKERFLMAVNVVVASKDFTPTAPPLTAITLNVTFYIGDGVEGIKFASAVVTVKGVGENETKAYLSALKNISATNPSFRDFLENGKTRIIRYYNTRCDMIVKNAGILADMGKYDEAIYQLASVPQACQDCYARATEAIVPIYKRQIDKACQVKLAVARNAWAASQNLSGADSVARLLSQIDPRSACFKDVKAFTDQVAKRVKEINNREWDFKLRDQKNDIEIIKAARDVAVAYANNPVSTTTVTYSSFSWW